MVVVQIQLNFAIFETIYRYAMSYTYHIIITSNIWLAQQKKCDTRSPIEAHTPVSRDGKISTRHVYLILHIQMPLIIIYFPYVYKSEYRVFFPANIDLKFNDRSKRKKMQTSNYFSYLP